MILVSIQPIHSCWSEIQYMLLGGKQLFASYCFVLYGDILLNCFRQSKDKVWKLAAYMIFLQTAIHWTYKETLCYNIPETALLFMHNRKILDLVKANTKRGVIDMGCSFHIVRDATAI